MDKKGLKNTYNKIAKSWHKDHESDSWWKEGTDKFISYLKNGGKVLDVGCGGGTKSAYLVSKGFKVMGIDFSESFIAIAKKEVNQADFKVLDIYEIDMIEEIFDGIFMQAVLLHIPKDKVEDILQKAVKKLRQNGYLYIAVKEKIEGGTDEEIKVENEYGYQYERFFSYFTIEELRKYFQNVGLEIVYEDVRPPTRTSRQSNWLQIIGKKKL